jgi:hypothetical protein
MKNLIFALICFIVLISQSTALELHASNTVVGNLLAEPYVAMLLSLVVLLVALI